MYIKSIVIEGFKSYGLRTEITGFDPAFNAITGLNGTGKSNILDSICFVFGISNLTHVRASTLQDLIYKAGRAGITRASVEIVFDNSDSSQSPINYRNHTEITVTRQIAVGGKNRYLINGSIVTNKFVVDFFSSVQLNVNNPHFLVLQGRITKVLNMKPLELLSMIQEAAGTRMYEIKKLGAQKTIEKKDSKLKEIDEIITESINPKFNRMKEEKSNYFRYSRIKRELEQLNKFLVAWEYYSSEKLKNRKEEELALSKDALKSAQDVISTAKNQIHELKAQIKVILQRRDEEFGVSLKKSEQELKEMEKNEVKSSVKLKSSRINLETEKSRRTQLEKSIRDDEKACAARIAELSQFQGVFDELREAQKKDAEAMAAAQKKLQAVSSGLLVNDSGENVSLQDQLMNAKKILSEAETEVKQYQIEIKHLKMELNQKRPLLKNTEMLFAQDKRELEFKEKELESLELRLRQINYDEGDLDRLQDQMRTLNLDIRRYTDSINNFESRYPQFSFSYKDPEPNFNRRQVRGIICKLFKVKDEQFARAIETAAGGRLYNVVVENESVSSKLIKNGVLARRTTFVPLNKIQGSRMNSSIVQEAQRLVGEDNVFLAQSLVEYDPQYERVMSFVFGQTLICTSNDIGKQVAFHPRIRRKTITIEGVAFDPAGVVCGGAVDRSQPILIEIMNVLKAEKELCCKRFEHSKINQNLQSITPIAQNYDSLRQNYDLRNRELGMIRERLQQSSHYLLQEEIQTLESSIREKEAKVNKSRRGIEEKSSKVSELENKMKNLKDFKAREMKAAEMELKRCKKNAESSRSKWKQREQESTTLNLDIQELEKSVQNGKQQIIDLDNTIKQFEEEIIRLAEHLSKAQEQVINLRAAVKLRKSTIHKINSELDQKNSEIEKLTKKITEEELEIASIQNVIKRLTADVYQVGATLQGMMETYKWIEDSRVYFGQPLGVYDFDANNPSESYEKRKQLHEALEKIGENFNMKILEKLTKKEEQYQQVMEKKGMIEEDRSKLLKMIEELDMKKEEVIKKAWEKVNLDFNSILSSLLPGAQACLRPVNEEDLKQGLQVRVAFGGLWKDSLDELSGGQRSLIALSLILAMLRFKPAPLYILDEVDAALDPSHTQNIGQMLKAHFRQSQFILVSLKEGMFNNANVIFRTSFVDGMSVVTRTTTA